MLTQAELEQIATNQMHVLPKSKQKMLHKLVEKAAVRQAGTSAFTFVSPLRPGAVPARLSYLNKLKSEGHLATVLGLPKGSNGPSLHLAAGLPRCFHQSTLATPACCWQLPHSLICLRD